MTVVVGTAGHIDHGKTTLLRALTGIDADRLPEERRRGMTIDVGYAHLTLPNGDALDFVDVPGHDRLVGNMLVGAGEIDAALLVVAADDGPRAQTIEHLALLDALGIDQGIAVVTKTGCRGTGADGGGRGGGRSPARRDVAGRVAGRGGLAGEWRGSRGGADGARGPQRAGRGRRGGPGSSAARGARLAIDRVFAVKGRGVVVTGTLRGGRLARGATLRVVPGDRSVRVREVQVHNAPVEVAGPGRTALNLAGVEAGDLHRGLVLTDDLSVIASDRILVRLAAALPDRARARVHIGTAAVDATVGRSGRDALDLPDGTSGAILRLAAPIAVATGDRLVLRRTSGAERIVGAVVLDPLPARGISRRRQTGERVARLAAAVAAGDAPATEAARLDLHGALPPAGPGPGPLRIAPDVEAAVDAEVLGAVDPASDLPAARAVAATALRRRATIDRTAAATAGAAVLERLVADGRLVRDGATVRRPGSGPSQPPIGPRGRRREGPPRTVACGRRAAAAGRGRAGRRLPARRGPRARARGPDRRPRTGPRLRGFDLRRDRGGGPRGGPSGAADPGRAPRRDRLEPQVRDGDPRRPRPARDPAPHAGRPLPGPRAGAGIAAGTAAATPTAIR